MNRLYRCFDIDEETPVQFVGVHPLRWRPAWGEPAAMFREAEAAEIAELPEVRALVEAIEYWIYVECVDPPASLEDRINARELTREKLAPFKEVGQ